MAKFNLTFLIGGVVKLCSSSIVVHPLFENDFDFKEWTVQCMKFNAKKSLIGRLPPVFEYKGTVCSCQHYNKNGNVWCYGCNFFTAHNDSENVKLSSIEVLRLYAVFKIKQLCEDIVKSDIPVERIKAIAKTLQEMSYYIK